MARFDAYGDLREVTFTVPAHSLARLEGFAQAIGITREEAFWEAVRDWNLARERSTNRRQRLEVEKALRAAKDREPVEELLERFRAQMEKTSQKTLTAPRLAGKVPTMHPLKTIMDDEGRRQSWLAERIGKHNSEVNRYLKGLVPPEDTRQAIADALGRTPADIWPDLYVEAA